MVLVIRSSVSLAALVLGCGELLFGICVIILSRVSFSKADMLPVFTPWWSGVAILIPGLLGVAVGLTKHYCTMILFMVFNVLVLIIHTIAIISLSMVIPYLLSVASHTQRYCTYQSAEQLCKCVTEDGDPITFSDINQCEDLTSIASLTISIMSFLVIADVISLISSFVGCHGTCYGYDRQRPLSYVSQSK
ncbi:uncharacterized protein [Clytia hemisphaerica]|uniref:Uncharacterized protein n=2 Tax=Clytia hemisphaerica TaxID=252671 RepID=A0A7M5XF88_9CNID|eukprot:TCONS_00029024-protein